MDAPASRGALFSGEARSAQGLPYRSPNGLVISESMFDIAVYHAIQRCRIESSAGGGSSREGNLSANKVQACPSCRVRRRGRAWRGGGAAGRADPRAVAANFTEAAERSRGFKPGPATMRSSASARPASSTRRSRGARPRGVPLRRRRPAQEGRGRRFWRGEDPLHLCGRPLVLYRGPRPRRGGRRWRAASSPGWPSPIRWRRLTARRRCRRCALGVYDRVEPKIVRATPSPRPTSSSPPARRSWASWPSLR